MKILAWILLAVALLGVAVAQERPVGAFGTKDRMFFPSDMFWGYGQFDLAPPHNEIDPNLCAANARNYGGADAPCSLFARYMLSGLVEVRPFGRGPLRRFMLFAQPNF